MNAAIVDQLAVRLARRGAGELQVDNAWPFGTGKSSLQKPTTNAPGTVGTPRELFRRSDGQGCARSRCYDISADGRFLFRDRTATKRETATRMDLVLNWTATLPRNP